MLLSTLRFVNLQNPNMLFFRTVIAFLRDKEYRNLLVTSSVILGIGTVVYHNLEGWNWIDSLYFSVITLTTIGYGDYSPQTEEGKLFTIFYILVGLGLILNFINTVYHHYRSMREDLEKNKSSDRNHGSPLL